MRNFSVTNLRPSNTINQYVPYYRNQTGNMGRYYPFEDKPERATLIHACAKRISYTALCAFSL